MSNHFSAAMLKFPGDDRRLDSTDLFVFASQSPDKTVLLFDVNPFGEVLLEGTPVGLDAIAKPVAAGGCRVFIGMRSDPSFADDEGAFHDSQFTGDHTFAGKNVLSMALEVPDEMLAPLRRSESGQPRASAATARSCRSTGSGTRRSTRPSSTSSRTSSTPDTGRRRDELSGTLVEAP